MFSEPSNTAKKLFASRANIKLVMGPVGGGKSTMALQELLYRAVDQTPHNNIRRTKFCIVRNTLSQLKQTVKPLIDYWFIERTEGAMGAWKITDNVFEARFKLADGTVVVSDFCMLPADTPDDVQRLLSTEFSAGWVEECREINEEVFAGLRGRTNRFPNQESGGVKYPGVIGSTNPPPVDTFWHKMLTVEQKGIEVFVQPPALLSDGAINLVAENLNNLAPDYYDNLVVGQTSEWIDVYLRNQFGAGNMGMPVFKSSFKREFHTAKVPLVAVSQSINQLVIGMDNGLQAAAVLGQQDMRGRINVLAECFVPEDVTMGVESFLDKMLLPLLAAQFPQFRRVNILFVLDPACFARSQVNEDTIAQAITRRGFTAVKAATNDPERRVQAVEGLLSRQVDGAAGLLVAPDIRRLLAALEWGYRYKKSSGQSLLRAEKNHFSHLADAFQYFCLHFNASGAGVKAAEVKALEVKPSNYWY
jgi:hypothetical protein